ncbi:MAG: hypothetical protein H0U85_00685 [Gemmatimonadales bacterium]|nr:hypothetical protein [Gemmatimonadales bacterium]
MYAAAFVRRYDRRTGTLAEFASLKTLPYGDVNFFGASRIQAGRISATGGLMDGDQVPDGAMIATRSLPAQEAMFPLRVWQGTLTDGQDALVINPTVWEQDGNNGLYLQWVQQQQILNLSIFTRASVQEQITQNAFGVLASGASGVNGSSALNAGIRTAADVALLGFGMPLVNLLQVSSDRPIGMVLNASAPDQTMLLNHTIVLTREIIEAALAQPARGMIAAPAGANFAGMATGPASPMASIGMIAPKPGILMVHMQDGPMAGVLTPDRPAIYELFIQVERVP